MKKPLNSMANITERIVLYVHYLIESVDFLLNSHLAETLSGKN